ncbi:MULTISPECIES: SRPBCC domain-containing protein [Paracoccus]|uniref:SRPBCC domain-containing protein n=1 Tax=Paracoccus TaxID=265 RepID=UPI001FB696C8|nr:MULTISPECIES: SRPBCC domain-containing protein [Paracoccus]MCJ1902832.1 SRPBCC domain-containing protein [Paracoccus versutus]MDF3907385.1 SRPBCC domain-containing protein [Paracoccus sp. AS002]
MTILLAAALVAALLAAAFLFAPRQEVVTEVEIDATPAQVWVLLGNPGSHRDWNPFILSMEGELAEGATLVNRMRPETGSEMTFRPVVLKAEPARELRWLGRLFLPRIFDGEHYFILDGCQGGTRLVHGENFHGVLLWFIDVKRFAGDFDRMNAALKARVEAGPIGLGKGR